MIEALLFDLDSCLCAANEVGDHLFAPAFDAIRAANNGTVSEQAIQSAFADCWRFPFDSVASQYGFSERMRAAGFDAFSRIEVREPMRGYPDLPILAELQPRLFMVTSGFRCLQQSKVNALGIAHLFTAIFIDAIDEPGRKGKQKLFETILEQFHFRPAEVLVVGDNPESEIAAGNRLGIQTVQILRPGVPPTPSATWRIHTLAELKPLTNDRPA